MYVFHTSSSWAGLDCDVLVVLLVFLIARVLPGDPARIIAPKAHEDKRKRSARRWV